MYLLTDKSNNPYFYQNNIQSSVTEIETSTFADCSMLNKISIPSFVTEIDFFIFSWCEPPTRISMPSSVNIFHGVAFSKCNSVTIIQDHAFSDCLSLFQRCYSLQNQYQFLL